jgi:hypothetical protein
MSYYSDVERNRAPQLKASVRLLGGPKLMPMKFYSAFSVLLLICFTDYAQLRDSHSKASNGFMCIAAPDRPTTGEKSLANPAAAIQSQPMPYKLIKCRV